MPLNLPYLVSGKITDTDSTNPNNAKVVLRNDTNGEQIHVFTDSAGDYVADLGNLSSGYTNTDRITIICSFGNASKESSFLISDDTHFVDLTLVTVLESSNATYCQVQDVLDELGDKTTSDISYRRIVNSILRAESEIDERTNTSFKVTRVTDEYYDLDQYTSYKSPTQTVGYQQDFLVGTRNDHWGSYYNDRFKLNKSPLVNPTTQLNGVTTTTATSITVDSTASFPDTGTIFVYNSTNGSEQINYSSKTSTQFTSCTRSANSTTASAHADNSYVTMIRLSKNTGGLSSSDSWTDLEPQVGGGGDFLTNNTLGLITMADNYPSMGMRRVKASYNYGYISVPKHVERLAILLAVKDVLMSKVNSSTFDTTDSVDLGEISITKGTGSTVNYITSINNEIKSLWEVVGRMTQGAA